jgi:hypothetical protein
MALQKILRLDGIIERNPGKIVGIKYMKKDGTIANMNGIFGVRRFLKGGTFKGDRRLYIVIWDIAKRDYRSVNRTGILELRAGRQLYKLGDVIESPETIRF